MDRRSKPPEHGTPAYAAMVDRDIETIVMLFGLLALAMMVAVVSVTVTLLFGTR